MPPSCCNRPAVHEGQARNACQANIRIRCQCWVCVLTCTKQEKHTTVKFFVGIALRFFAIVKIYGSASCGTSMDSTCLTATPAAQLVQHLTRHAEIMGWDLSEASGCLFSRFVNLTCFLRIIILLISSSDRSNKKHTLMLFSVYAYCIF